MGEGDATMRISFGPTNLLWARGLMDSGPYLILAKGQISFWPRVKSHLGPGPNLIGARGRISFGRILENNTITFQHRTWTMYILHFDFSYFSYIFPPVIENKSLISDVIASPKESLITDVCYCVSYSSAC